MNIRIDSTGMELIDDVKARNLNTKRENKGRKLNGFVDSYCVIDIETTGLSAKFDNLIELAAVKVIDGEIVSEFTQLVDPGMFISSFITSLTGISDEMVNGQPSVKEGLEMFLKFIGELPVVCHNTGFDINFIYDEMIENDMGPFTNDHYCTLNMSRKLVPELKSHRLKVMKKHFRLNNNNSHRALDDAKLTQELIVQLKNIYNSLDDKMAQSFNYSGKYLNLANFESKDARPIENDIYQNIFCFTGTLEQLTRKEAAQLVVEYGGTTGNGITKKTNFLVIGSSDYLDFSNGIKTSKLIKAEKMLADGLDINIIPEQVFYDMLIFD